MVKFRYPNFDAKKSGIPRIGKAIEPECNRTISFLRTLCFYSWYPGCCHQIFLQQIRWCLNVNIKYSMLFKIQNIMSLIYCILKERFWNVLHYCQLIIRGQYCIHSQNIRHIRPTVMEGKMAGALKENQLALNVYTALQVNTFTYNSNLYFVCR